MYDPLELAQQTAADACRGELRKYYRFRPAKFYGGIATGDCVGCCLRCVFCWSWDVVNSPAKQGKYYTPQDVTAELKAIARSRGFKRLRISGNEPTLNWPHLLAVLRELHDEFPFILETNGVLIGSREAYARDLARFGSLHVRVSLKGASREEFSMLTGAAGEGFDLQLKALEHLARHKVQAHPACMVSFSTPTSLQGLRERLKAIHPDFEEFEAEELILYPAVKERLKNLEMKPYSASAP